ncbi:hypothetical protein KVR01_011062 [Diaporthe batatas]|uniref:uncharacterized protein n=1 Tax=Diaporthe batatas TaxID=748121 RepID=UPI001D04630A|nr:uncharacterized protein KVR01_011062 [Diaporthe batatas]KAG8159401.1 hypothetical protein KVR01_011062 [Diaporthe batatas]
MAPLVGYGSSDEEDDEVLSPAAAASAPLDAPNQTAMISSQLANVPETEAHVSPPPPKTGQSAPAPETGPVLPPASVAMGPSLPPADQREAYPEQVDEEDLDQDQDVQAGQARPPSSPYSASRALLHQLTLPTVPDLDIPPSPPLGSPSSGAKRAALTAKFDKFLELKRTKGVHFNARIAESHAFRNPEQPDKLLSFVGIDTKFDRDSGAAGATQYSTTLPVDLWDPAGFPAWAYRGRLRLAQEKLLKERTRTQGEPVQFVSAANP